MPSFGAEQPCVQNPIIGYVTGPGTGWTYIPREDAEERRGGQVGSFFYDTLGDKLLELNRDILDTGLAAEVIKRMQNVRPSIEGNAEILSWLRGERTVYHPAHNRELNVTLIDFANPANNTFEVTDEWSFTSGRFTNRADIVFLVNGVPVVIVETKAAHKDEGVAEGIDQIRRYHRETPEMLSAIQIFDVQNLLDWYYGVTWNTDRKNLFNWKAEQPGNFEKKVKAFFSRERILRFLRDYILFVKKDDDLKKFILRQHQTRAIEKVVERSLDRDKRTGLVWHTQGSGKTFTMITAAEKLIKHPKLEKPTVLMLVDRNELETQLFQNLTAYGFGSVTVALRKNHLRDLLASGQRGLIVSMIHKFEGMPKEINTSRNVFVLIDEAHRTTAGDLGNYLMAALPNATYFGFTGTPIDKTVKGSGTFKVFGKDDPPKGFLDKYSMAESIEDGTTLRLNYTIAPNDMLVDQETLEREFLSLAEAQGISDIDELNKILERAVTLKTQLKAHDRVEKVAAFVADHFRKTIEPMGYKAFLVGVDREACALYKKALDRHLPPEYSTVVYSEAHNDREHLKEYYLSKDAEKKVRKEFAKKSALPKILIVTEKLLTGYDAPILYCMYLDKPMRDHVLLQTIARVNRPYEDDDGLKKPAGFVLDFVGIFDKLERALAFDSDEVASVINDLDLLKDTFARLMKNEAAEYLALVPEKATDKECEAAIEYFDDKERRNRFFSFFKQVESLYEIISPDAFLYDYIGSYNRLARLYALIRAAFSKRVYLDKEFLAKTAGLVRENVTTFGVDEALPVQTIDENTLEALKQSKSSDKVKVINLIKRIGDAVEEEGEENPFLLSIGERADAIADQYYDKQISTQDALHLLETLVTEYNDAKRAWQARGMPVDTFSIFWAIHKEGMKNAEELAVRVNAVFEAHPHWRENTEELRALKRELYVVLMKPVGRERIKEFTDRLMRTRKG